MTMNETPSDTPRQQTHPVQAMVLGIVSLVLDLGALDLIIGNVALYLSYGIVKEKLTGQELQYAYAGILAGLVVLGVFGIALGVAGIILSVIAKPLGEAAIADGKGRAGKTMASIAFPLSIVLVALSTVLAILLALTLAY
jgi:hypothetical protein